MYLDILELTVPFEAASHEVFESRRLKYEDLAAMMEQHGLA